MLGVIFSERASTTWKFSSPTILVWTKFPGKRCPESFEVIFRKLLAMAEILPSSLVYKIKAASISFLESLSRIKASVKCSVILTIIAPFANMIKH